MKHQRGFTLVELAIVLVIIGLILGAAFKGKDLIDGAKVKNMAAQVNKMQAGFNTYFEKYGAYPGDGCTTSTACAAAKDGIVKGTTETPLATAVLIEKGIMTAADIKSIFGSDWQITDAGAAPTGFDANTNYMTPGATVAGVVTPASVDIRFVCALDNSIDDGDPRKGIVRSSATKAAIGASSYQKDEDCWASAAAGAVTLGVRVLP
jgi:prepilin-type N-terminal cleavage/methylation domain-containing protein